MCKSSEANPLLREHRLLLPRDTKPQSGLRLTEAMRNRRRSAPSLKHIFNLRDVLTLLREHRLLPRDTKAVVIPARAKPGRSPEKQWGECPLYKGHIELRSDGPPPLREDWFLLPREHWILHFTSLLWLFPIYAH